MITQDTTDKQTEASANLPMSCQYVVAISNGEVSFLSNTESVMLRVW